MKKFLLIWILAAALLLVACTSADSGTLCEDEEDPCVGVRFDGTECTVEDPSDTVIGEYTFIFTNESELGARVEIVRLDENRTVEEAAEYAADNPYGVAPSWVMPLGLWNTGTGETVTLHAELNLPATYAIACSGFESGVSIGGGFTVEE